MQAKSWPCLDLGQPPVDFLPGLFKGRLKEQWCGPVGDQPIRGLRQELFTAA